MLSRGFKIALLGLLVAAGVVTAVGYHFANRKLQRRIDGERRQNVVTARLRVENQQAKTRLAQFARDEAGAKKALQADVERLRGEVAALEKRALAQRARHLTQTTAEADELANNRDATKGFMRAEFAVNAGRATPGAAFQTLIWAALKGQDDAMSATVLVTGVAREKAEALLAGLPPEARAKYPTPEKLAALFFANSILEEVHAFRVLEPVATDATHARLPIRFPGNNKSPSLPLELGPDGWRIVIVEKQIDLVRARLTNTPMSRPETAPKP
jgi:hypothetical protein